MPFFPQKLFLTEILNNGRRGYHNESNVCAKCYLLMLNRRCDGANVNEGDPMLITDVGVNFCWKHDICVDVYEAE
jgi:hypothetical protein